MKPFLVSQPCDTEETGDEDANPYKQGASNDIPSFGEGEGDVISSQMEMDMNNDGADIAVCSAAPCEGFEKGESLIPGNASDHGAFIDQRNFTGFDNCIGVFVERAFQGFADLGDIIPEFETAEFDTNFPVPDDIECIEVSVSSVEPVCNGSTMKQRKPSSRKSRSLPRLFSFIRSIFQRTSSSKRDGTPTTSAPRSSKIMRKKIQNRGSQNREAFSPNDSQAAEIFGLKNKLTKFRGKKKKKNSKQEYVPWLANDNRAQDLDNPHNRVGSDWPNEKLDLANRQTDQLNNFPSIEHQFLPDVYVDNCLHESCLYLHDSWLLCEKSNQETDCSKCDDVDSLVAFADDSGLDVVNIPICDARSTQPDNDVPECATNNQVQKKYRTVKFSTSGEDFGEDLEQENVEDKENYNNDTDIVEVSVEDAPTFANGIDSDGDDKDDETDRDRNNGECEENVAMDTEVVKLSKFIRELRKLSQQALDDHSAPHELVKLSKFLRELRKLLQQASDDHPALPTDCVHLDFDGKLPGGWTIRIEENKVEIVEKETGLPSECYMEFPTISEFRRFSKPLYQTKHISSPKDPYKEEGPPIADSNSSHLLESRIVKVLTSCEDSAENVEEDKEGDKEHDIAETVTVTFHGSDGDGDGDGDEDKDDETNEDIGEEDRFEKEDGVNDEDMVEKDQNDDEDNVEEDIVHVDDTVNEEHIVDDKDTVHRVEPFKDVIEVMPVMESNCTPNSKGGDNGGVDGLEGRNIEEECEETSNEICSGDTRDVVIGTKSDGECEENCAINTDDNMCGTTNESMCKVDHNYGGVGGSGGDGDGGGDSDDDEDEDQDDNDQDDDDQDDDGDDDGDGNIEAESVEDEDVDEKADTDNDEEIVPSAKNETDLEFARLASLLDADDDEETVSSSTANLKTRQNKRRQEVIPRPQEMIAQLQIPGYELLLRIQEQKAQLLDQIAQLWEENARPQEVPLTSRNYVVSGTPKLWNWYEVEINVKQPQLRELEPFEPLLREKTMSRSFMLYYRLALLQYCFGGIVERELVQQRLADILRIIRHIAFLFVMLGSILGVLIDVFLCSVQPIQTPRGKSHRNNSSSKLGLPPKPNNHNWDGYSGYDNGNAIWMQNRKSDSDTTTKELAVTPITKLYHKQETDEWEVILKHLRADYTYLQPANTDILCYTIPRYPDNHNPLLPLALQKKLDEMTPREYLTYVLRELTLEERESLMVDERQRRKTFLVNWPRENNLSGVKMALAGFYCVDDYDRVQCVFCRGSLHKWESSDNPMTEHARSFNFCRFVKGLECGNREYKNDVLSPEELKNISFFGTPEMKKNRDGSVSTDSRTFGISTNKADTIQYAPEPTRRKTFARWPASSALTPQQLGEAGFYFTGFDDQVRCFYCSGGLREWKSNDDPWEEHARWFPECSFLVQQKGEEFVNEVHAKTPANKKCTRSTVSQKKAEKDQIQQLTNHQVMVEFCRKMGHSEFVIKETIRRNGGQPFEEAYQLVDAIYSLDDDYIDSGFQDGDEVDYPLTTAGRSGGACALPKVTDRLVAVPEEDARKQRQDIVTDGQPGLMDGGAYRKSPPGCCIVCYRKAGLSVDASQIALPCGHVVYCERCGKDEKQKVDRTPTYKPRCPYLGCGGLMTGTFKMFLN